MPSKREQFRVALEVLKLTNACFRRDEVVDELVEIDLIPRAEVEDWIDILFDEGLICSDSEGFLCFKEPDDAVDADDVDGEVELDYDALVQATDDLSKHTTSLHDKLFSVAMQHRGVPEQDIATMLTSLSRDCLGDFLRTISQDLLTRAGAKEEQPAEDGGPEPTHPHTEACGDAAAARCDWCNNLCCESCGARSVYVDEDYHWLCWDCRVGY